MAGYEGHRLNLAAGAEGTDLDNKVDSTLTNKRDIDIPGLIKIIGFYESQGLVLDTWMSSAEYWDAPKKGHVFIANDSQDRKTLREWIAESVKHITNLGHTLESIEDALMPYELTKDSQLWEQVMEYGRAAKKDESSSTPVTDTTNISPQEDSFNYETGSRERRTAINQYLIGMKEVPLLTADEEKDLAYRIAEGDESARDHLARANLRLVVSIAKNYQKRGLPLHDLIEEGNVGLMKAVDSFDPEQGTRFSTYGSWWIKQAIKRALINSVPQIHVPAYMVELIVQYKAVIRAHELEHNTAPSVDDIANIMEVPTEKVEMIKKAVKAFQRPSQSPVNEDGKNFTMEERLTDTKGYSPDQAAIYKDTNKKLYKTIETLDERESQIIRLIYGLDGEEPLTLKQISRMVGLTSERVWQIEAKALEKLKEHMTKDGVTYP